MRLYVIAGEASGDLHASHLMAALRQRVPNVEFRGIGGDSMAAEGLQMLQHYKDLAYMGFLPVLRHLPTILRGMKRCRQDILEWKPDGVILVDYAGFNLPLARFVKTHSHTPVFYYIPPKIWAWKEGRIKALRRYVDRVLCILPFEVDYYRRRHDYEVSYVGNPTAHEVAQYEQEHPHDLQQFAADNGLSGRPIIALLPGSRKQEIRDNLRRMVEAAAPYAEEYEVVVAAAPGISDECYSEAMGIIPKSLETSRHRNIETSKPRSPEAPKPLSPTLLRDQTFRLLQHSTAALVTSGTATLETALFGVPQVVCYYMRWGGVVRLARRLFLRCRYISLPNLIADAPVIPELVANDMNVPALRRHLSTILPGGSARETQLNGYRDLVQRIGETDISAADVILNRL